MSNDYVKTKLVKELVREQGMNMSGDFIKKLNELVEVEVLKACGRGAGNTRKTVQARDL